MDTSASLSAGLTRTPPRGWAIVLLSRFQVSSIIVISYTFGVFLPFIKEDLNLSLFEAGLLQGIWWSTAALLSLPFGVWFSRFRPAPLIGISLALGIPFLVLQGLAQQFLILFWARFLFVLCHVISTPARPLILQQWAAPKQYALVNAVGLSQHSALLALAISTSALLIVSVGSWRLAYFIQGGLLLLQLLVWIVVARESRAPVAGLKQALQAPQSTPLKALLAYPQGWLLGITMSSLAATWTALVTFLPTRPSKTAHRPCHFWTSITQNPAILGIPM